MKASVRVILLTMFIDLLGFGLIIPILPIYGEQLGATGWEIGAIAASYSLMQFIFAPFWGGLSDSIGRKPVLKWSILISIVGYIFFANAHTLIYLFLARSVSGIGSANISVAQAYISDVTTPENRAKYFGLIGVAFGLGFILGPPVGGFVKEYYGVTCLGYTAMVLSILNLISVHFFLTESNKFIHKSKLSFPNPIGQLLKVGTMKGVSKILFISFIYVSAFSMMHITASLLWSNQFGCSEAQIGYIFAFIGLSVVIAQGIFVGPVNKALGERKMLAMGCVIMAIGLGSMPFVPSAYFFPLMFISLVLIAFGNGFSSPALQSILSQLVPENEQGKVMGAYQSVGSISRIVGPLIGAGLYDISFSFPYVLSALLMLVCFIIAGTLSFR